MKTGRKQQMRRWVGGLLALAWMALGAAHAAVVFIDFGVSGTQTTGPDANGHYWNNAISPLANATLSNMLAADGSTTSIGLLNNSSFGQNGGAGNGGLASPSPALLGDFAIASATIDYWFAQAAGGISFRITGLSPGATYNLSLFGTRATTANRSTRYTVTGGAGATSQDLATSGAGIGAGGYNGNNNTIISFLSITADQNNQITVKLAPLMGSPDNFAYIGALEIEQVIPEPSTLALMVGGVMATYCGMRRRRRAGLAAGRMV